MNDDKIIADYMRIFHPEMFSEKDYKAFKAAYPQLEQVKETITPVLQAIYEAMLPAISVIFDAANEQEKQKQEDKNDE